MANDNAGHTTPIIAWDFDGTLCMPAKFPNIGEPRQYAKEVVNFLYDIGVHSTIWTCRSKAQNGHPQDDITPAVEWLNSHGFRYHDINECIVPDGFNYESRKIFAHMYVDDRGFGWFSTPTVLLIVLSQFLTRIIHVNESLADSVVCKIMKGGNIDDTTITAIKRLVRDWR